MGRLRMVAGGIRRGILRRLSEHYFVSFPKSGRTWTKSVLANYYSIARDTPVFHDFAPIVRPRERTDVPRIVFTHAHHDGAERDDLDYIDSLATKKVILLVRHPMDVVQTYYYRLVKRQARDDVARHDLESFALSELGLPRIVAFLNRWYGARASFAGFHLLSYERCVADPETCFGDLLRFLDDEPEGGVLNDAVRRSRDTTRKIEAGGVLRDESTVDDIVAGDRIYFGRENATATERFEGSGKRLSEIVSDRAVRRLESLCAELDPELVREMNGTIILNAGTPK